MLSSLRLYSRTVDQSLKWAGVPAPSALATAAGVNALTTPIPAGCSPL